MSNLDRLIDQSDLFLELSRCVAIDRVCCLAMMNSCDRHRAACMSTDVGFVRRRSTMTRQCRLRPGSSRAFHARLKPSDRTELDGRTGGGPAGWRGVDVTDVRTSYRSATDCIDLFRVDNRPTNRQDESMSPNGTPSVVYAMHPNLARPL